MTMIFHQKCGQIFKPHQNEQQTVKNRKLNSRFYSARVNMFLLIQQFKKIQFKTCVYQTKKFTEVKTKQKKNILKRKKCLVKTLKN